MSHPAEATSSSQADVTWPVTVDQVPGENVSASDLIDLHLSGESPLLGQVLGLEELARRSPAAPYHTVLRHKLRRVIAEDLTWSLATVPPLQQLCVQHIAAGFEKRPIYHALPCKYREDVVSRLSIHLPLHITACVVEDESYWRRCCEARYGVRHPARPPHAIIYLTQHGDSWHRAYLERHLWELVESFIPGVSSLSHLCEQVTGWGHLVRALTCQHLLPGLACSSNLTATNHLQLATHIRQQLDLGKTSWSKFTKYWRDEHGDEAEEGEEEDEDESEEDEDKEEDEHRNHIQIGELTRCLPNLEHLKLSYRVKDVGMNFEWSVFGMTQADCDQVCLSLSLSPHLTHLSLPSSLLCEPQASRLLASASIHPCLTHLDLSHNRLSHHSSSALYHLLAQSATLSHLTLAGNRLGPRAGQDLGEGLRHTRSLRQLDIARNNLQTHGAKPVLRALLRRGPLRRLNIASNMISSDIKDVIEEMMRVDLTLRHLDMSTNNLGEDVGREMVKGLRQTAAIKITTIDLRLTGVSEETLAELVEILEEKKADGGEKRGAEMKPGEAMAGEKWTEGRIGCQGCKTYRGNVERMIFPEDEKLCQYLHGEKRGITDLPPVEESQTLGTSQEDEEEDEEEEEEDEDLVKEDEHDEGVGGEDEEVTSDNEKWM